jgi:UPF0716 protein FxsA
MIIRLFLLFAIVPLVELYLLIKVGSHIGALPTIALVVVTAFVGAWLAKREGLRTFRRIRERLSRGAIPGDDLVDAILILAAGIVLLTPGLITDALGLLILIPPVRARLREWLKRKFSDRIINRSDRIG